MNKEELLKEARQVYLNDLFKRAMLRFKTTDDVVDAIIKEIIEDFNKFRKEDDSI